jgi:tripartite-type tricarboxylate transporter receptor subunit TctC
MSLFRVVPSQISVLCQHLRSSDFRHCDCALKIVYYQIGEKMISTLVSKNRRPLARGHFARVVLRQLAGLGVLAVALFAAHGAAAQAAYPVKPVRVVVPFASGGANDLVIRLIGERLQRDLGQPFVVDNRPGANGNIAAAGVERAAADGHTLLMGNLGLMVHNHVLYPKPGFDRANFIPVSCMVETVMVLKVPPGSQFQSARGLVTYAKANPGKLNYASVGNGSAIHLGAEMLMNKLGITAVHIPFNGGGQMMTAVMSGTVDFVVDPLTYGDGKVRALAVLDARRKAVLPDTPTIEEAGFPPVNANSWIGLFAPKGTPDAVISSLSGRIEAALKETAVRDTLLKAGLQPCEGGQAKFVDRIRESEKLWEPLVRSLNIKLD